MSKDKNPRRVAENEAMAVSRMLRTSPQKLNLVAAMIRNKPVGKALSDLTFSKKRVSDDVKKTLQSAIANAENNHGLDVDELVVAEAFVARAGVHVGQVLVLRGSVAELDAVEAAQVDRRLGRGQDVVDRDRQLGARQRDGHAPGAQALVLGQRRVDGRAHAGGDALAQELRRHADAQAVERPITLESLADQAQDGHLALGPFDAPDALGGEGEVGDVMGGAGSAGGGHR